MPPGCIHEPHPRFALSQEVDAKQTLLDQLTFEPVAKDMSTSVNRSGTEKLRERIRRLEGAAGRRRLVLPFGLKAIDQHLPGGGLALGAFRGDTHRRGNHASMRRQCGLVLFHDRQHRRCMYSGRSCGSAYRRHVTMNENKKIAEVARSIITAAELLR
jgi:hypothetical protein